MRSELVYILHLMTGYSEQYLDKLTEEELNRMYDAEMEKSMNESACVINAKSIPWTKSC